MLRSDALHFLNCVFIFWSIFGCIAHLIHPPGLASGVNLGVRAKAKSREGGLLTSVCVAILMIHPHDTCKLAIAKQ